MNMKQNHGKRCDGVRTSCNFGSMSSLTMLAFITVALCLCSSFAQPMGVKSYDDTQFAEALKDIKAAKQRWQSFGITSYAYSQYISCFCMWCWIAPKYIVIEDSTTAIHVEYYADEATCGESDIEQPVADNYHAIDYYFDEAIKHAQRGVDAACADSNKDSFRNPICGGGITIQFDPILSYPTGISLQYGPFIADAGMCMFLLSLLFFFLFECVIAYTFKCLSVLDSSNKALDLGAYDNECTEFKYEADPCELPKEIGPCRAAIQRYYYDARSGECTPFYYGGCQGNDNNFHTRKDCEAKCKISKPPVVTLPPVGGDDYCCSAASKNRKAMRSCPKKTSQQQCEKMTDKKSGNSACEWTLCSNVGVCEYDGHSQGRMKKMKRVCAKADDEEECRANSFCQWSTGADALDAMIENVDYYDEEEGEEEIKENVFAVNFEHSVKENVYKGSLYAMAGVGVVGCAFLAIYKKRKLSTEIATANTSFGENNEYGSIA